MAGRLAELQQRVGRHSGVAKAYTAWRAQAEAARERKEALAAALKHSQAVTAQRSFSRCAVLTLLLLLLLPMLCITVSTVLQMSLEQQALCLYCVS
jgi:hypothetical protein